MQEDNKPTLRNQSPYPLNQRKLKSRKRRNLSFPATISFDLTPKSLSISLPLPPSINQQYATVNGRRVLSSMGRQYKNTISQILLGSLAQSTHRTSFLKAVSSHFLALSIHFYFTSLLRRDIDGGLKISQDALCEALGVNDNRIVEIHLFKTLDRDNPRLDCTLTINNLLPAEAQQHSLSRYLLNRHIKS